MRKSVIALMAALPAFAFAQSAIDALQITQPDFKGTARFMSMGGAFTALGGDLSTLGQNPGGIGVYRKSDIGVTLDINMQSTKTDPAFNGFANNDSQTKAYCNNFGYIGTTNIYDSPLKNFNWGVTYNRAASFDRAYRGYVASAPSSLTSYIASFSKGIPAQEMDFKTGYNPYLDSSYDWLSILAYSSYLISPTSGGSYTGLAQTGTKGDALFDVLEKGYVDEYDIAFGGNVENVFFWGLNFGITDLNYTRTVLYSESMSDAYVPTSTGAMVAGDAGFDLNNRKYIKGTGWDIKFGFILRPVNELRIGLAVHSPTWYKIDQGYDGTVDFSYFNPAAAENRDNPFKGNEYTDYAHFNWRFHSPWRILAGVAGVIGSKAIISLDYEYAAYGNMKIKTPLYDSYGYIYDFQSDDALNDNISSYYKGQNTLRVGLEYRVSPQFSLRAGYNVSTTNVNDSAYNGIDEVITSGTDPSYSFTKNTSNICAGLGYKYKAWYIDAAYVYTHRESTFHAFTGYDGIQAPISKITDANSSIVISTGFRF